MVGTLTLHTRARCGALIHTSRTGPIVTVRGESVRASPVRIAYPRDTELDSAAQQLAEPGESLEPMPLQHSDAGNAGGPIIRNYLARKDIHHGP